MFVRRAVRVLPAVALVFAALVAGRATSARSADLSQYLSKDFCGVLVIHPERIGESTLVETFKSSLPKELAAGDPATTAAGAIKDQKNLPPGMDAEKLAKLLEGKAIHRIVVLIEAMPSKEMPASGAVITQFSSDVDGEGILSAITNTWQPAETGGVKYKKFKATKPGEPDMAAFVADNRMLIFGMEGSVVKMLAKETGERPLLAQLKKSSFDNDMIIEYYAEPMWAAIAKATGKSADEVMATTVGKDPMMTGVLKDIKSVSIKVNLSGTTLLHGEVATGKQETAGMISMIGNKKVGDMKADFEKNNKSLPIPVPAPMVPMISKLGDEFFAGLKIQAEGTQTTIELTTPESLPGFLKALGQIGGRVMPKSGAGK